MSDIVIVYFKAIERGFSIHQVLFQFSLFGFDFVVRWYGVLIALGFTLAVLFGGRMAYKWKMNLDKMLDVLIYGTILGIIGARLYYVIFQWDLYKDNLSSIFKTWEGGLAMYGGLIGGLLGAYIACRVRKLNFRNLLDLAGMSFLIGQGIGRWGNFTNQEAFGTNTSLPWGMWSEKIAEYVTDNQSMFQQKGITMTAGTMADKAYVHPTFLYESLWCLLGFAVLYIICKKYRKFSGQIFLCYGIWYGTGRMIIEGFRTDSLYLGGTSIRVSQLLSAVVVATCAALLAVLLVRYKKNPQPIEGVDFFVEDEPKPARGKKPAAVPVEKSDDEAQQNDEEKAEETQTQDTADETADETHEHTEETQTAPGDDLPPQENA